MYVSNNQSNYGGLGKSWGLGDDPAQDIKSELPASIADDDLRMTLRDPQDFIPKPKKIVGGFEASQILRRPHGARGGKVRRTKGRVYWQQDGPKFSETPIKNGATAENVEPPVIKLRPSVTVVRDLPVVKSLTPVETSAPAKAAAALQGFGEAKFTNWVSIFVLGLLFLAIFGYNKP